MADKESLRKKYISIRKAITEKELKSEMIFQKVISAECYRSAETVALYYALGSEVSTEGIIRHGLENGKKIYLPRIKEHGMIFYRISEPAEAKYKNSFGIYEPMPNNDFLTDVNTADIFIIPGICFDLNKNRIGFGKGFYDRYLKNSKSTTKAAICFEEQILKDGFIQSDNNDIRMDIIITEERIIN